MKQLSRRRRQRRRGVSTPSEEKGGGQTEKNGRRQRIVSQASVFAAALGHLLCNLCKQRFLPCVGEHSLLFKPRLSRVAVFLEQNRRVQKQLFLSCSCSSSTLRSAVGRIRGKKKREQGLSMQPDSVLGNPTGEIASCVRRRKADERRSVFCRAAAPAAEGNRRLMNDFPRDLV